jgi:transposase
MHSRAAPRRRHGAELKAQVLAECDEPGASVAAVAQSHGLNANLVHKWRRRQRAQTSEATETGDEVTSAAFVALQLPSPAVPAATPDIRIELCRGATTMNIAWPGAAAAECAAWLREWLR